MLIEELHIGLRHGIRIEHGIRPVGRLGAPGIADAAVDDDVADMDALGMQLARAIDWARPRRANLPIAKAADWG